MTDKKAINELKRRQKAISVAIQALKEREERSKGCEYCVGFTDQQREDFTMPNNTKKDFDIVKINFCPMCGRPLKGADK